MTVQERQTIASEFLGSLFLLAAVVGSGILGERLANGNTAVALLANSIATGAILLVLIQMFGPVSGAHFNPVVTAMLAYKDGMPVQTTLHYAVGQLAGAIVGVVCANVMFGLPPVSLSLHARSGTAQIFSEAFGTFGLLLVILVCGAHRQSAMPQAVAGYITAAYWFTGSTCFANPTVTVARALSDTFAGIRPIDVPSFIVAQVCGGVLALASFRWMTRNAVAAEREDVAISRKGTT
jgi:glycerol uptake facilitator-like aquaporin